MLSETDKKQLIEKAVDARKRSYSPYSHYPVGAAVLAESGKIYQGANIENAAYPSSICAERSAIFNAVSKGERKLLAIAVVTKNGGSPCGGCRQRLAEFAATDARLHLCGPEGVLETVTLGDILPRGFKSEALG